MFEQRYILNTQGFYKEEDIFVDALISKLPLSRWTTVSADDRLMNHLYLLFITWDNIVGRAFYRPLFEEDIVTIDPKSTNEYADEFCSQFLVNALLAASCVRQFL